MSALTAMPAYEPERGNTNQQFTQVLLLITSKSRIVNLASFFCLRSNFLCNTHSIDLISAVIKYLQFFSIIPEQ